MILSLLQIWRLKGQSFGFSVLEVEKDNYDENNYALIGISYFQSERLLQIDLLWHVFDFNLSKSKK